MNATEIGAVSTAVVALTQLLKWSGVSNRLGPLMVLILSAIGTAFYAWSFPEHKSTPFDYFAAWIIISTAAAGVFGFTRQASEAITSTTPPPSSGAGAEPVRKITDGKT